MSNLAKDRTPEAQAVLDEFYGWPVGNFSAGGGPPAAMAQTIADLRKELKGLQYAVLNGESEPYDMGAGI